MPACKGWFGPQEQANTRYDKFLKVRKVICHINWIRKNRHLRRTERGRQVLWTGQHTATFQGNSQIQSSAGVFNCSISLSEPSKASWHKPTTIPDVTAGVTLTGSVTEEETVMIISAARYRRV